MWSVHQRLMTLSLSLTAKERKSVCNKLKMADGSSMASEVLEGGRQGQTHTHTHTHLRAWTQACTHTHTHTHTRMYTRGQGGAREDHLPPLDF